MTPRRVAELRADLAAMEARLQERYDVLAARVDAIEELPLELARAQAKAAIETLRRHVPAKPSPTN